MTFKFLTTKQLLIWFAAIYTQFSKDAGLYHCTRNILETTRKYYLQFLKSEATSATNLRVVPDGGTSDLWP